MTEVTNRARSKPRQQQKAHVLFTSKRKATFLKVLHDCGIVRQACEVAGVVRQTVYTHRDKDKAFAGAWQEAVDDWTDVLEQEADRRALGYEVPIVYQGQIQKDDDGKVATVRQYSDRMLELRLKALRPDLYSDRFRIGGDKDSKPIEIKVVA